MPSASIAAFLVSAESAASVLFFPSTSALRTGRGIFLPACLSALCAHFQPRAQPVPLRPRFSHPAAGSAGISTCCPSPTRSRLGLGPDLPWADDPSPGNLRFSTVKILTSLSLLIPAFSLPPRPRVLSVALHPLAAGSPTSARFRRRSAASAHGLAPLIFGADSLD